MRKAVAAAMILVLAFTAQAVAASGVKWYTLKEGREKAQSEKKPMIVDFFFGKGCPRCEFLQTRIYDDPAIAAKIMADFIPIRIDLTGKLTKEEEQLGNSYEYKNDCLLLFLDRNGTLIRQPGGTKLCFIDKVEPRVFIQYLDELKEVAPK